MSTSTAGSYDNMSATELLYTKTLKSEELADELYLTMRKQQTQKAENRDMKHIRPDTRERESEGESEREREREREGEKEREREREKDAT